MWRELVLPKEFVWDRRVNLFGIDVCPLNMPKS